MNIIFIYGNRFLRSLRRQGFFAPACLLVLLLFCVTPSLSQTKWFKYEGNPVLDVGPPGSWKDAGVLINRVLLKDSVYHAWHSANDGTHRRVGFVTSRDGIHWTAHDSRKPVVDLGAEGISWDSREATVPYVTFTGSKYHMWYHGFDGVRIRIGYASSPDGIVWAKANKANPVLTFGPSAWDAQYVGFPSVLGPDAAGGYQMWYSGNSDSSGYHIQMGYATATNPISWKKHPEPVLPTGDPGSWDDRTLTLHRVLYNGQVYEMWYAGSQGVASTSRTGYATSMDGIHWTKYSDNPVLHPGPPDSWDAEAAFVGDVLFDGSTYRMWYGGFDGSTTRTGYAISPRGTEVEISADRMYVAPGKDTVLVSVRVNDPSGLSFSAEMESSDGHRVGLIELFDDGAHDDRLAGDAIFANRWMPTEEQMYFVDLKLNVQRNDTLRFEMNNAAIFTTIGPVLCERVEYLKDRGVNPGDTVLVSLTLRNHGASAGAQSVAASLSSTDASVSSITESSPAYGDIPAGESASTVGHYRIVVSPYSPIEKDVEIKVSISSFGIPLWYDTFTLRVIAPWWRTNWAYGLYLLLMAGSIGGTVWYVGNRKLRHKIERLEQERALERERARISQDMHDEVGATLTEIAILSELAKKKPEQAGKQVQQISDRAAEVIDNIGEIIWAMNPKNDSLDNLIAHLRRYTVQHLALTDIGWKFIAPESIPPYQLSGEARRNLFLVVKEALHNIVKHSAATQVVISVQIVDGRMEIVVKDNGKGFLADGNTQSGNGLGNMNKRMSDIGGTFRIESEPNQGTIITMVTRVAPRP